MNPESSGPFELRFEHTLKATTSRVWSALTEASQIARWYGPGDDFRVEVEEWDCRVGGKYRVAMHPKEGGLHTCQGVFKTIEPERRISYTWSWVGAPPMDSLVTFELEGREGVTLLKFTHEGFPTQDVSDRHLMGWTGSLARLAKEVGRR